MHDGPEALRELEERLDALEKRVQRLEHPEEPESAMGMAQEADLTSGMPAAVSLAETAGWFPVLGRALLGIAGAYLLRAVVESGLLAPLPVAVLALAYTFGWVVWAVRMEARSQVEGSAYAATSVLILGPMLWELVLRFHAFGARASAVVLCGYVVAAGAIAWRRAFSIVPDVVFTGAAVIALGLAIATHALLAFVAALLLLTLLGKIYLLRGPHDWSRALVSLVTDAAVWLLIYIYSAPPAARENYAAAGATVLMMPGLLLFAMDAVAVTWTALGRGLELKVWQVLQAMLSFALAAASVLTFVRVGGAMGLGAACLILSTVCYAAAFGVFRRKAGARNFAVYATWSGGLLMAGLYWALPLEGAAIGLSVAALGAVILGVLQECGALEIQGAIFLGSGALAAGLPGFVARAFLTAQPERLTAGVAAVTVLGAGCYAVVRERVSEGWRAQLLHLVPALVAACGGVALLVHGTLGVIAHFIPPSEMHAVLTRTLALCVLALLLAFAGAHWHRLEVTRIAYAALIFMAVKLLYEDLRVGRMGLIAASIFVFAVTLIGVPRMAHPRAKH